MAADEELAARLEAVARAHDMRTDQTDWRNVATAAARYRPATAALARAVNGTPLRLVPLLER